MFRLKFSSSWERFRHSDEIVVDGLDRYLRPEGFQDQLTVIEKNTIVFRIFLEVSILSGQPKNGKGQNVQTNWLGKYNNTPQPRWLSKEGGDHKLHPHRQISLLCSFTFLVLIISKMVNLNLINITSSNSSARHPGIDSDPGSHCTGSPKKSRPDSRNLGS